MENWYAVYTKAGWEKKVSDALAKNNIENYCPLKTSTENTHWWNFKKHEQPVFNSRIFVKASSDQLELVKRCNGVISLLYWLGEPAVIKEAEIDMMKKFLDRYENVEVEKTAMHYTQSASGNVVFMDKYNDAAYRNNNYKVEIPTLGVRLCAIAAGETYQLNRSAAYPFTPEMQFDHKHAI